MEEKNPMPYQKKWQIDCGMNFTDSHWESIWNWKSLITKAINIKIQSFKLLAKWYMTPLRLHFVNSINNPRCWKQCGEVGCYIHCLRKCPIVIKLRGGGVVQITVALHCTSASQSDSFESLRESKDSSHKKRFEYSFISSY